MPDRRFVTGPTDSATGSAPVSAAPGYVITPSTKEDLLDPNTLYYPPGF